MDSEINEIKVNGLDYVRKDNQPNISQSVDGMNYCVIRSYGAG
jgi:hypothetical protein